MGEREPMKHERTRTIPREGPPCQRCGRPTQPRTNWQRVMAFLPVTERFLSDHHHLCRRCYRKSRPNDRRTMPGLGVPRPPPGAQNRPKTAV